MNKELTRLRQLAVTAYFRDTTLSSHCVAELMEGEATLSRGFTGAFRSRSRLSFRTHDSGRKHEPHADDTVEVDVRRHTVTTR
jgi:hypothetical protein